MSEKEYPSNNFDDIGAIKPRAGDDVKKVDPEQAEKLKQKMSVKATVKKRNVLQKMSGAFMSGDMKSIGDHLIENVIIPQIKIGISDVIKKGIDILFYGESKGPSVGTTPRVSFRSYDQAYYGGGGATQPKSSYQSTTNRTNFNYDEIVVGSRAEAVEILDRMNEIIGAFDHITIAGLYEIVGLTAPYSYHNYGWTNVQNAMVQSVREGWLIKLPSPILIK